MTRKIVQIAAIPCGSAPDVDRWNTVNIFALCNDGSLWEWYREWVRLEDIPQDEEPELV